MTRHPLPRSFVALLLVAMTAGLVGVAAPASALPGSTLIGHRCKTYNPAVTNEDTIPALISVSRVAGAWCEIDAWTLSDGTVIIWHDNTWKRVADHSTLPAGVAPTDNVRNATWAQVRQIRTKGGARVPRLGAMIDASAKYHVPLLVEIRNTIRNPGQWVAHARARGARVRYYKTPTDSCATLALDGLRNAGAVVGLKLGAVTACHPTPAQIQAKRVSFVTQLPRRITTAYTRDLRNRGIAVYASGAASASAARSLLNRGAVRLIVERPGVSRTW